MNINEGSELKITVKTYNRAPGVPIPVTISGNIDLGSTRVASTSDYYYYGPEDQVDLNTHGAYWPQLFRTYGIWPEANDRTEPFFDFTTIVTLSSNKPYTYSIQAKHYVELYIDNNLTFTTANPSDHYADKQSGPPVYTFSMPAGPRWISLRLKCINLGGRGGVAMVIRDSDGFVEWSTAELIGTPVSKDLGYGPLTNYVIPGRGIGNAVPVTYSIYNDGDTENNEIIDISVGNPVEATSNVIVVSKPNPTISNFLVNPLSIDETNNKIFTVSWTITDTVARRVYHRLVPIGTLNAADFVNFVAVHAIDTQVGTVNGSVTYTVATDYTLEGVEQFNYQFMLYNSNNYVFTTRGPYSIADTSDRTTTTTSTIPPLYSILINSDQTSITLRSFALGRGWNGRSPLGVVLIEGFVISGSTTGPAITIDGDYPNGLSLINNGYIIGMGGAGGRGDDHTDGYAFQNSGRPGSPGGTAISVTSVGQKIYLTNNGVIAGGGGGGGGGRGGGIRGITGGGGGGGGGRSGRVNSAAGGGGYATSGRHGSSGQAGTFTNRGAGGNSGHPPYSSSGGYGGDWGEPGDSGYPSGNTDVFGYGRYAGGAAGNWIQGADRIKIVSSSQGDLIGGQLPAGSIGYVDAPFQA